MIWRYVNLKGRRYSRGDGKVNDGEGRKEGTISYGKVNYGEGREE